MHGFIGRKVFKWLSFLSCMRGITRSDIPTHPCEVHIVRGIFLLILLLGEGSIYAVASEGYSGSIYHSSYNDTTASLAIMVDTFTVIQAGQDIPDFLARAKAHGVDTIFLLGKKRDGDRSGYVIWGSSSAPPFYDWDVLKEFSERAHGEGIKVYVQLPLLFDDYLFRQEGFGISNGWVSPINSGVKKYLQDLVSELQQYAIEGILFDDLSYEDEYSASRELQNEFNRIYHYEDLTYSLPTEKERDSPIWRNWLAFKRSKLEELYLLLSGNVGEKRLGIAVPPTAFAEDNQEGADISHYQNLSLVAVRNGEGVRRAVNGFNLQTDASLFVVVENSNVRTIRDARENFTHIIFRSPTWDIDEFKRIEKASDPFSNPMLVSFSLLDYFSTTSPSFTKSGIDTLVIQAGHVGAALFYYSGRKDAWSPYVLKYKRDYVGEYSSQALRQALHVVLTIDASSPEYIVKYPRRAALDMRGTPSKSKVSIIELTAEESYYRKELLTMMESLSTSYDADAILLSGVSYLDEDFGPDALSNYIAFMKTQGQEVRDWPRNANGDVDLYSASVCGWKSAQMEKLLSQASSIVHKSNKEFWVFADVSWTNPGLQSSEYGLSLPMLEKYADRILLDVDFQSHDLSSTYFVEISKNLPTVHSERYTMLVHLTESPDNLKKNLTDIENLKFYSFGIVPYSSFTQPFRDISYRMSFRQEVDFSPEIKQLWDNGFYEEIPRVYRELVVEDRLKREREKEKAKEDFSVASQQYAAVEKSLNEAQRYGISTDSFKASFLEIKGQLSESQARFLEENFGESSRISLSTISSSENLERTIKNAINKKLRDRFTLSIALLLLFFIIILFTTQYLRRKK
jgi:hypothetical protein